jgi:hypothetical protein
MIFASEPLYPFWDEAQEMFKLHYDEIAQNKNAIKLDPDVSKYKALFQFNALNVYTARDNGKLVGYGVFVVSGHLHYKTSLTAESDLLYIHPDYRKGMAGYKLVKFCHGKLHDSGVQRIMWRMKPHRNFSRLIERLGGKLHEYVYTTVR